MPIVFQCPACRTLVTAAEVSIPLDGSRAGLPCSACRSIAWLPATGAVDAESAPQGTAPPRARVQPTASLPAPTAIAPRAPSEPVAPYGGVAPRLTEEQRELVHKKLAQLAPAGDAQRGVADDFKKLLGAWEDASAHKGFLQRASAGGELSFAGQSYRAVLDAIPGEPAAKKAQNEILALAMASLASTRDLGAVPQKGRTTQVLLIAGAVVLLLVTLFAMSRLLRPDAGGSTMGPDPRAMPVQE
jgi:hypothetical protein